MIEHNTFEEFYNEFKNWSKKDILKRVYDLINETNKWTDVYLDTMNNQEKEIKRLNNIINETLKRVSNIQHNLEKYEEIGYKHLEYAMNETDELKEYLIKELKENK